MCKIPDYAAHYARERARIDKEAQKDREDADRQRVEYEEFQRGQAALLAAQAARTHPETAPHPADPPVWIDDVLAAVRSIAARNVLERSSGDWEAVYNAMNYLLPVDRSVTKAMESIRRHSATMDVHEVRQAAQDPNPRLPMTDTHQVGRDWEGGPP